MSYFGAHFVPSSGTCSLVMRNGQRLTLVSRRPSGRDVFDRSADFALFVTELLRKMAAYPEVDIRTGMPWPLWLLWAFVFGLTTVAFFIRQLHCRLHGMERCFKERRSGCQRRAARTHLLLATGLSLPAAWRILRNEWPRRCPRLELRRSS
jgi:hypothetical protein